MQLQVNKLGKSPVMAGRKGSPETGVFSSGKGTLSICGVTQFKELKRKRIIEKHNLTSIFFLNGSYIPSLQLNFISTKITYELMVKFIEESLSGNHINLVFSNIVRLQNLMNIKRHFL